MKPYIQQIAERLDDLQPVNGSYVQAIAELLWSLDQSGGNVNYAQNTVDTNSTSIVTLSEFDFPADAKGYMQIKVLGRDLDGGQFAQTESNQFYFDGTQGAKSITPILGGIIWTFGSDNLGDVGLTFNNTTNTYTATITPNNTNNKRYWIFVNRFIFN